MSAAAIAYFLTRSTGRRVTEELDHVGRVSQMEASGLPLVVDYARGAIENATLMRVGDRCFNFSSVIADQGTLWQLRWIGLASRVVPVRDSRGTGSSEPIGSLSSFRIVDDELRADVHLNAAPNRRSLYLDTIRFNPDRLWMQVAFTLSRCDQAPTSGRPARIQRLNGVELLAGTCATTPQVVALEASPADSAPRIRPHPAIQRGAATYFAALRRRVREYQDRLPQLSP